MINIRNINDKKFFKIIDDKMDKLGVNNSDIKRVRELRGAKITFTIMLITYIYALVLLINKSLPFFIKFNIAYFVITALLIRFTVKTLRNNYKHSDLRLIYTPYILKELSKKFRFEKDTVDLNTINITSISHEEKYIFNKTLSHIYNSLEFKFTLKYGAIPTLAIVSIRAFITEKSLIIALIIIVLGGITLALFVMMIASCVYKWILANSIKKIVYKNAKKELDKLHNRGCLDSREYQIIDKLNRTNLSQEKMNNSMYLRFLNDGKVKEDEVIKMFLKQKKFKQYRTTYFAILGLIYTIMLTIQNSDTNYLPALVAIIAIIIISDIQSDKYVNKVISNLNENHKYYEIYQKAIEELKYDKEKLKSFIRKINPTA